MNKKRISIILSGLLMMTMVSCTNKDNISISLEDNKARVIENIQAEGTWATDYSRNEVQNLHEEILHRIEDICTILEVQDEYSLHEEVKDENDNIIKMGLSTYNNSKPIGTGLNEAAVQYIAAKIIGIEPDFEKYYDINIYTPSPSYYPVECALLNELIFLVGEDLLFKSTYFSTDDFKNEIINHTSKKTFCKIQKTFDDILKFEENIIILNNKIFESNKLRLLSLSVDKVLEHNSNNLSV